MQFYDMSKVFGLVSNDKRFIQSAKLAVEHALFPSQTSFRGDKEIYEKLAATPRSEYFSILSDYPFPYFSFCEDLEQFRIPDELGKGLYEIWQKLPEKMWQETVDRIAKLPPIMEELGYQSATAAYTDYCNIRQDAETRNSLLARAKDKSCLEWWTYIHNCETQAIFLTYPALKILFPKMPLYLVTTASHVVITNKPELGKIEPKLTTETEGGLIFDPISQAINDLVWFGEKETYKIYNETEMVDWFIKQYVDYEENEEEIANIKQWWQLWS